MLYYFHIFSHRPKNLIYLILKIKLMSNISKDYFAAPFSLDESTISNLVFYSTEKYLHATWYNNQEKAIFLQTSIDGKMFTVKPTKIMDVEGEVKDIKIIAKDDDFVITAIEEKEDGVYIRAATGILLPEQRIYDFKPCEKVKVPGKLINAYTVFTKEASMDYIFWKPDEEERGNLNLKARGQDNLEKNEICGIMRGSHCTRLSILKSQIQ